MAVCWLLERTSYSLIGISAFSGLVGCVCVIVALVLAFHARAQNSLFAEASFIFVLPFAMAFVAYLFGLSPNVHGFSMLLGLLYFSLSVLAGLTLTLFGIVRSAAQRRNSTDA